MAHTLLDYEQAKVFDLINQLGAWGIHHLLPLPQLIVCGDQSSGKSLLLEAISGFSFPVRAGKCTRFPTQVVLKRTAKESSHVSILPGEGASPECRSRLESFKSSSTSLQELRNTIDEAQAAMSLGEKFSLSDNILRIEICGPTRPHLTLVDLPGLISSTSDTEPRGQIDMIEQLVRKYMLSTQSIILAVVSASTDADNQRVLQMVKVADPSGERTIAVVTKPDVKTGPEGQRQILSLVQNETYHFQLGWHLVRNIDRDTFDAREVARDMEEAQFLSQNPWNMLPRDQVGVPALQERLSAQLCRHISKEIPNLIQSIQHKLSSCTYQLQKLGEARNTSTAQRIYLSGIAEKFQTVAANALAARYQDTILSRPEMQLRARVRELQDSLHFSIKVYGPSLNVTCSHLDLGQGDAEYAFNELKKYRHAGSLIFSDPTSTTCEAHAELIKDGLMRDRRGLNLPSLTDPGLLWEIFKDLSMPWSDVVDTHLELTFEAVSCFVTEAFRNLSDEHTYSMLREDILEPILEAMQADLADKKKEVMAPYMTFASLSWNPSLIHDLVEDQQWIPDIPSAIQDPSAKADHIAALRLVHHAYAFYGTAQRTMVDNIANLTIESCLLNRLKSVLKAGEIAAMSDEVLARLAGEPEDAARQRRTNETMKEALSKALKRCREYESTLIRRAMAGEDRIRASELAKLPSSTLGSRSVHHRTMGSNASALTNTEHARSLTADFGHVSLEEAGERQKVPPLTPNRSPSRSPPKLVTPGDLGDSSPTHGKEHRRAHSTGSFHERTTISLLNTKMMKNCKVTVASSVWTPDVEWRQRDKLRTVPYVTEFCSWIYSLLASCCHLIMSSMLLECELREMSSIWCIEVESTALIG